MNWLPVGASLFASNIGSGHFVGLAGSGAASGIGIAQFELNAILVILLLGWVFVPVYMAAGVFTMPEYLQKRFGGQRIRIYLAVLALLLYVFTKISVDLFAGALFIEQSLGWNLYVSIILLLTVAAIFTIAGGLTAVIWTDFVQTILMLAGSVVLMLQSFAAVGGYGQVWQRFLDAKPDNDTHDTLNRSCGSVPPDSLHFFRDPLTSDLPWTGITFGLTVSAVWYWCSDQVIVQRVLAARSLSHAKAGTLFAGYLKLLPLYLLVVPGMIARILFPNEVGCAVPSECQRICGSTSGCSNIAYPLLVLRLMPTGLSGMMMAVMMAALLSSLTSIFNSSSTIFTMDIWTRLRKDAASETELVIVGRLFVLVLVVVSVVWIPVIKAAQGSRLFVYIQSITSYLAPPICAVYVLAVLCRRVNEKGAFWSLMLGLVIGMVRFVLEFGFAAPSCGSRMPDPRPPFVLTVVGCVHFLHFGAALFVICAVAVVAISFATEPIEPCYLHRLTFWDRFSREPRANRAATAPRAATMAQDGASVIGTAPNSVTSSVLPLETGESAPEAPLWKKLLYFLCGATTDDDGGATTSGNNVTEVAVVSKEQEAHDAVKLLEEAPRWRHLNNVNAAILVAITLGMWIYYA